MTKLVTGNKYPGNGYYYVLCDICGFKIRAKDAKLGRDNLLLCRDDFELQHPLDKVTKPRIERPLNPKLIRPEGEDTFGTPPTAEEL